MAKFKFCGWVNSDERRRPRPSPSPSTCSTIHICAPEPGAPAPATHTYTHTQTHAHIHTHTHTYTHTARHTCARTHTHTHVHAFHTRTHTGKCPPGFVREWLKYLLYMRLRNYPRLRLTFMKFGHWDGSAKVWYLIFRESGPAKFWSTPPKFPDPPLTPPTPSEATHSHTNR